MTAATALSVQAPVSPGRGLRAQSVAFLGTVGMAVGIQAPTGGVTFLPALMAATAGSAGPLAFAGALVALLFVAYAFVLFTRQTASAGSVYVFNGRALGPSWGFISVWALLGVYLAFAASVFSSNANVLEHLLVQVHHPIAWPILAGVFWGLTIAIAVRSIRVSAGTIFTLEAVSLLLVAVVAVAVISQGGYHGTGIAHTMLVPPGLDFSTLGLGVVFAFTGFSGFEVAATLGEEAGHPQRVISWSLVVALLVSGSIYTVMSWVETVAYASPAALAGSSVPLVDIARAYVSPSMATGINLAAIISGFGAQVACVNGAARLFFALGRDGCGPRLLTWVHPHSRSPLGALTLVALITLLAFLPFGAGTPLAAFFDLSTYGADLILVVYLITLVAAAAMAVRERRFRHVPVLGTGLVILGYVLKTTVYPVPPAPFSYCMLGAGVTVAIGIVLLALPRLRQTLRRSTLFVADRAY